jgi:hypothetical protein
MFRGASIVLMRWDKLSPLATDAGDILAEFGAEIRDFLDHSKDPQTDSAE